MKHKAEIQQLDPARTPGATGELPDSWIQYASRSCSAVPMKGRDVIQSELVQGVLPWTVVMRYDAKTKDITSGMRIVLRTLDDRTLYCDGPSAPINGEKRYVEIRAMEQTA